MHNCMFLDAVESEAYSYHIFGATGKAEDGHLTIKKASWRDFVDLVKANHTFFGGGLLNNLFWTIFLATKSGRG